MKFLLRLFLLLWLIPLLPKLFYRLAIFFLFIQFFLPPAWVSKVTSSWNYKDKCFFFPAIKNGQLVRPDFAPEWKLKQTLLDCNYTIKRYPKLAGAYASRALILEHFGDRKGAAADRCQAKKLQAETQREFEKKFQKKLPFAQIVGISAC